MSKEKKVINFYILCNKLKDVVRTGWKDWNVNRDRIESVAEHIFGVEMLAIAIASEYDYNLDMFKVIYMIAIHELGETIIGDYTPFQITKEEKEKLEHEAVHKILSKLLKGEEIEKLFLEFDAHITEESKFAHHCDKLECDLQCKLYDEEKCVDITDPDTRKNLSLEELDRVNKYKDSWSTLWLKYDQQTIDYDDNFRAISEYALNNQISKTEN